MIPRLNLGTVPAPCRTRRRSHRDARPSASRSAVCRTSRAPCQPRAGWRRRRPAYGSV